jgi:hypothetical protein
MKVIVRSVGAEGEGEMKRRMPRPTAFNAAKYRNNPKLIAKYLNDALATDDPAFTTRAIGNLAHSHRPADARPLGRDAAHSTSGPQFRHAKTARLLIPCSHSASYCVRRSRMPQEETHETQICTCWTCCTR